MKKIFFTKMQGLGNDFVVLDWEEFQELNLPPAALAKTMCKRNFAVGAAGLMIVVPQSDKADLACAFYDSDGKLAQISGNEMHCFAKYVLDKGYINKHEFSVETAAEIIFSKINEDGTVTLNMGRPTLELDKIPFKGHANLNQEIELWAKKFSLNAVGICGPHCVIFADDDVLTLAKDYGPDIETHELFPEKTHVEFVRIRARNEIDLVVWERGKGVTFASGTGAGASVVVGILNGLLDNKVKVNFQGGSLIVEWNGSKDDAEHPVSITGDADFSFEGVYYYNN